MAATGEPPRLSYRKTGPPGAGRYEALWEDRVIGTVGRFGLAAGQFGSRWTATTPRQKRSGTFPTRDAAAGWLIEQAPARD